MTLLASHFLPFYILYLVLGSIERVKSTFSGNQSVPLLRLSKAWFLIPFYVYFSLIIFSIFEFFLRVKEINLAVSITGLVLYFFGAVLRRKAITDLAEDWSIYSEIRQGHILRTSGIYQYLKHPYYVAVMLELSGACLVANAFYALALAFIIQTPLLMARIYMEERMLMNHFQAEYDRYVRRKFL